MGKSYSGRDSDTLPETRGDRKMIRLIKAGKETNQLDYFFAKISEQYIEKVEYKTSTLSSVMEPLIIIFLGLIVGVILISMYLPLFQMSNSFQ